MKKYNWSKIQEFYNNGNSWRDVMKEFGVSNRAVEKATLRGDLKLRTRVEAAKLSLAKYGPRRMGLVTRKERDYGTVGNWSNAPDIGWK